MPKVSEMITSKFLRQADIEDDTVVTTKGLALEVMPGDGAEKRWTLTFRELPKAMVLNVTSIKVLAQAYGQDTDAWVGKRVTLYVDPNVSYQGKVVGGLRLRPMKATKPAKEAKADAPAEEFNDAIPY